MNRPPIKPHSVKPNASVKIDKSITSRDNALVREWLDCQTSKGIKKHGQFIISGERAVRDTLERFPKLARNLIVCADRHSTLEGDIKSQSHIELVREVREATKSNDPRFSVVALTPALFDDLDAAGTHQPLLVVMTPSIPEADLSAKPQGLEVLVALGDPANLGALLRSAAAFGASRVILLKECASPFHPKAVRAASAATLAVPLAKGPSIKDLPEIATDNSDKGQWVALDMHGKLMNRFEWPKNVRLILGEEGQGVPESKEFQYLAIPMKPKVESLNATVASSIALFSYSTSHPG